jgi:hypothetical protein
VEKRLIAACMPRDINELVAGHGLPRWTPTIEHTLTRCENAACGKDMWIGPKQKAMLDAYPDQAAKLCVLCALEEQQRLGGGVVGHLGGGDGRPRT